MPPKGPATKALTLALFLCLAAQVSVSRDALGGDGAAIAVAYGLGAIDREAILGGQWQRLIAAPFLHFGVFHLLMNAWAQWSLGGPIEFLLGSARFLALWTLSALGASLTSLAMNDTSVSAGASGAIFGLLGAFTTFVFLRKDILRQPAPRPLRQGVIATILLNILISFIPNIDVAAHLGGFVTGAICGLFLSRRDPRKPARPGAALMPWFVVPGLVSIGVGVTAIQERASSGLEPPGTFVPYQVGELQLAMPLGFRVSETRSGSTVSLEGEGGAGSPYTVSYKITEPLPTEDAAAAALRDLRKPAPDGPEDSSWIGLARYGVQNGRAIEVVVVAPRSLKREAERLSAEIARRIR